MPSKMFNIILWILVFINFSSSWSSTINSVFKSHTMLELHEGLNPVVIQSVANGVQMAMDECSDVFKWDRWNCPESSFSRHGYQLPTKEKAYTDAIIAAGIIYSITRDCSEGIIKGCGCDPTKNPNSGRNLIQRNERSEKDWQWGGCSDDSSYGENLVLKLLDDNDKHTDAQGFVNRHNNRIGREIIRDKMLTICKCHGVSGTCSLQTCWSKMPKFQEIAKQLRERYDRAIMISFEEVRGGVSLGNSARQLPLENNVLPKSLVFLERSPDFCVGNSTTGVPGTKGRICSRASSSAVSLSEKRSCRKLCRSCGYKVKRLSKKTTHMCNCKFNWCCEVQCQSCVQIVDEFSCH